MKKISHLTCLTLVFAVHASAAPVVSHLRVTDVTPTAFRVIWQSDEPAAPSLEVFANAAGTVPVAGAVVVPHHGIRENDAARIGAEHIGILSVHVSGLDPDTLYHFRATTAPAGGGAATVSPFGQVRTANSVLRATRGTAAEPIANPILKFDCLEGAEGAKPANGKLLVAEVAGAKSPVTSWVDEQATVLLDLNNLFSAASGESLRLAGFEPLTLTLYLGGGETETFPFFVPAGDGMAMVKDPYLTATPLSGPVVKTGGRNAPARVFMEFPATQGSMYVIEASETLTTGSWRQIGGAVIATSSRIFAEDNGRVTEHPAPANTPRRLYRLRFLQ